MALRRIDQNIEHLISNLKLTKPNLNKALASNQTSQNKKNASHTTSQSSNRSIFNQPVIYDPQLPVWKQLSFNQSHSNNPLSQYDSVVNDTYDDTNNYSFYQLKHLAAQQNLSHAEEFSFCQHTHQATDHDDSLNRFSSIVDKLKTEGDQSDSFDTNFFYDKFHQGHLHEIPKTDRIVARDQPYYSESQNPTVTDRKKNEYFSGSMLKSTQKNYKAMSKKSVEHSLPKPKAEPIYAKLILNSEKQNNHQNSNICPKNSVITSLITKRSNYSSAMKKPFNPVAKISVKPVQQCPLSKVKVKQLNQKIRKQNQIVYQSEMKEKSQDVSPLQSFKKSTIQPHKFSTYKVKLFG